VDWSAFIFTIALIILLVFILFFAAGIASGDWEMSPSMWFRFLVVAVVAVFLIPALQSVAADVEAGDLALLLAFLVILFMIKLLIIPELAVTDEWMSAIFAALLTVFITYILDKLVTELLETSLYTFI